MPLEKIANATYYPTVSYHGGLVANLALGEGRFSLQPEVNFSQRRVRADYTSQGITLTANVYTNRLEVPVLLKATFGDATSSRPRFFVYGGPYGAYALEERYKANIISYGTLSNSLRSIADALVNNLNTNKATYTSSGDRLSYGVAGGLGVAFGLGPGQLTLEGRSLYELGRSKPVDPTGTGIGTRLNETKYMLLQASVGYLIPIGGR